jgi:predicted AAA+ superfamily ATPase
MSIRHLAQVLKNRYETFRSVYLHGPRQVGKTTLCRGVFPEIPYASLENPDQRMFAQEDPRGFLAQFPHGAILDEVQKVPDLLSYLQEIIDAGRGKFILTGSQNLLLMEGISQSLAGRIAVLQMLPLSRAEFQSREASDPRIGEFTGKQAIGISEGPWEEIFIGGYPEPRTNPDIIRPWADAYIATYLERDVRTLLKVQDLGLFQRFLVLCAARSGQLLNIASLSSDSGVSEAQCRRWITVLQASELVFLLLPYHENLGKRITKMPKLYFTDTGLLCRLLGLEAPHMIPSHPSMGAIFETFVVNELRKCIFNRGERPAEYFWRDKTGHEVDYLLQSGAMVSAFECKAAQTLAGEHFRNLAGYVERRGATTTQGFLAYGGSTAAARKGIGLLPWWRI